MIAIDLNSLSPIATFLGLASMAGGAALYSKTKSALDVQSATLGAQQATISALEAGLTESRTMHADCEKLRIKDRGAWETARNLLQAQIIEVKAHNVAEFVTAIEQTVAKVVRTELEGKEGRDGRDGMKGRDGRDA